MLNGFSVGIHLVDVDAGDSRIIRVIIEEKPRLKTGPFGN